MHREKASAVGCAEPADVVDDGLLCVELAVDPSCATWLSGDPPHADTSSDRLTTPTSAEARTSVHDRWGAFTQSMIARADNSPGSRR
jgi:hypothetical protein